MHTIYCGRTSKEERAQENSRATAAGERPKKWKKTTQVGNREKERVCDSKITIKECNSKQANGKMK